MTSCSLPLTGALGIWDRTVIATQDSFSASFGHPWPSWQVGPGAGRQGHTFGPSEVLAEFLLGGLVHPKSRQVFKYQISFRSLVGSRGF